MVLLHQFWNSVMICRYLVLCKQYDCWQVRYLWDQKKYQVKVILAFIHYIYTTYEIAVKRNDDVRTRTRCFGCWNLCLSHSVRYSTHTINICCQKENRLSRLEILLSSFNFGIYFRFACAVLMASNPSSKSLLVNAELLSKDKLQ